MPEAARVELPPRLVRRGVWTLLALAFLLRLGVAVLFPTHPQQDAADYHQLAANLAQGEGFVRDDGLPTAWRPPGYPFFLAGVYTVLGISPPSAFVVHALLGTLSVYLLIVIGMQLMGPRVGLGTGLLAALYPTLVWPVNMLLSENLALPLLLGAILCTLSLVSTSARRPVITALLLGILLGAAALVRGAHLAVAGLLLAGLLLSYWRRGARGRGLALTALAACCTLAVIVPWSWRNRQVLGEMVPLATQDGITLYSSYWPPVKRGRRIWGTLPGKEDPVVRQATGRGNEATTSAELRAATLQRLRRDPARFFRLIPEKLFYLLVPFDWELLPHGTSGRTVNIPYLLSLPLALWGLVKLRRSPPDERRHLWLLAVIPLATVLVAVLFYGSPRFRHPAETSLLLLAAAGVLLRPSVAAAWPSARRELQGEPDVSGKISVDG